MDFTSTPQRQILHVEVAELKPLIVRSSGRAARQALGGLRGTPRAIFDAVQVWNPTRVIA